MENLAQDNLLLHGIVKQTVAWDKKTTAKTEALCHQYKGDAARACWVVIAHLYTAINKQDPPGFYQDCQKAPDKSMRDDCFIQGVGVITDAPRFEGKNIGKLCDFLKVEDPLFSSCMNHVIFSLMRSTPNNASKSVVFCGQLYSQFYESCLSRIITVLRENKA